MAQKPSGRRPTAQVFDFAEYVRRRGSIHSRSLVYYISESGEWTDVIQQEPGLLVRDIRSLDDLSEALEAGTPEVVILDAWIGWANIYELVRSLHKGLDVSAILLWNQPNDSPEIQRAVKAAYAAGASDNLFTPLCGKELHKSLDIHLRFLNQQRKLH